MDDDSRIGPRADHRQPTLPTPGPETGQRSRWRSALPFTVALAVLYLLPGLIPADLGLWLTALLVVNPLATFAASAIAGLRRGFLWQLLPLAALAWLPATFVVYNDSALPYALGYFVFALAGLGFGAGIRGLRQPRATSRRRPARSSDDADALDSPTVRCAGA